MNKLNTNFSIISTIFVLSVWVFMLLAALALVGLYGTRTLPQNDEPWLLYDAGTKIHLDWLWKPWAEHRIPLAKLIWKSVLQLTGYDFRIGNFVSVLSLGAIALAMIRTARNLRGGSTIFADAFFPLAILNFGQATVFLWWWQINQLLAPVIVSLLILLLIRRGNHLEMRQAVKVAACLILLSLCGPGGLPYVLTLAFWLAIWGRSKWPRWGPKQRKKCLWVLALSSVALGILGAYFVDYTPYFPINDPPSFSSWPAAIGPLQSCAAILHILAISLGTATKSYSTYWGLGIMALALSTFAILARIAVNRPDERFRSLALLAILVGSAVLAVVIGMSRSGMGLNYIYQGHYLTLIVPALCCGYFAWEIRGGFVSRFVQLVMVAVLCILSPVNIYRGWQVGLHVRESTKAFECDIRNQVPASIVAEHYFVSDAVPRAEKLTMILRTFKKNGIGIFKEMRDDPPSKEVSLSVESAVLDQMSWRNGIAVGVANSKVKNSLSFVLSEPRYVYSIRIRYTYLKTKSTWPTLQLLWRNSRVSDFNDTQRFMSTVSGPNQPTWVLLDGKTLKDTIVHKDRVLTAWVDATIDQIRIYPDQAPSEFKLSAIELIEPFDGKVFK